MVDDFPEALFEQIYRRAPSDADRARVLGIKSGLGLSARDELWPIILVLDHYSATTAVARREILKAVGAIKKEATAAARDIGDAAGKKAEGAVALAVEKGSDKICQVVTERVRATADDVAATHKRRERIAGAGLALVFIGLGAALAWVYIEAQVGICREPPVRNPDGSVVCYARSVFN
ncbi:hypothetical protein [Roseovarius nanhaiticus]|uniref:hypothetical protein n=1 Tax=Roseovarius nanhaiticus TaxID=573024 RepID=UPI0024920B0A|nr:hypothetical protein [Roseovarius nanhaiticus]